MLDYGREICCDGLAARREWLVTNGIGGFASGTLAGVNTRRYHGLLIAALQPPLGRTLLVSGLRDQVDYDGVVYPLAAQAARPGAITPGGVDSLMRFHLEDTTPVWTYAFEDALLEKRVWMQTGANTTYIRYQLLAGSAPAALQVDVQINWRDMHGNTRAEQVAYTQAATTHGLKIGREGERASLYILSSQGEIAPGARRPEAVFLAAEHERGLNPLDHVSTGATLRHTLKPGESLTLVLTTEVEAALDGDVAYAEQHQREDLLVLRSPLKHAPDWIGHLVLAADQFIVRRAVEGNSDGRSVIAGYHWFGDWGRDTMIALPGLTLATGRFADAATILRTFARFVSQGMLPNRFPDSGDTPEYNTVDATLWYFEAIRAYHAATGDDELVRELYPTLREIIAWHVKGTRYNIGVDPVDGLLHAGEPGVQLTWMDVKIGGWVVTPRHGKPVEINALWYNALRCMVAFAQQLQPLVRDPAPLQDDAARFERMAEAVRASFGRFWNSARGCLYDVIDTPEGNDAAIRPNQLFAVSLYHNVLDGERAQAVVAVCARKLLTSAGLRSLAPDDPHYIGVHTGNPESRDSAYHQGTVWAWLIGPFVSAHYRVHGDKAAALRYLEAFRHHLDDGCVGTLGECAHGDPPHRPTAAVAQAWSVAEALRVYSLLERT